MELIVSADELEKFHRAVEVVEKLGGLFKAAIASAITVCTAVAAVAVWVNTTSATAEQTKDELHALMIDRKETIKEWSVWRIDKDRIDTRLTILIENKQRNKGLLDQVRP